jgi:hypothetical protein
MKDGDFGIFFKANTTRITKKVIGIQEFRHWAIHQFRVACGGEMKENFTKLLNLQAGAFWTGHSLKTDLEVYSSQGVGVNESSHFGN